MEKKLEFTDKGTLGDYVKNTDDLFVDDVNLADVGTQIYVRFNIKGTKEKQTAILSWPITKMLRSKRIALGNIFDFPMSQREDETNVYSVHMEERELRAIKRNKLTIMKITKVEVTDEETIVL